ncbi:nitrilase-related carbon-nitrogen hydrolase [Sorangium sp. So ce1151]|uniref:nitrilase-related carbon-nitrogen hydrolase n=1 Tax=unclassified Sorangium TaxID=2621164 RepID=UPI003F62AD9C
MEKSLLVRSCVAATHREISDKIALIESLARDMAERYPDHARLLVMPQEFFGGRHSAVLALAEAEIAPDLIAIADRHDVSVVVGVTEQDGPARYQRAWFLDRRGIHRKQGKFALASYERKGAGSYGLTPTPVQEREVFEFPIGSGLKLGVVFCWEAFSDYLWSRLSLMEPDLLLSLVKFGSMASPTYGKNAEGLLEIDRYAFSAEHVDPWVERLEIASAWEVRCPIVCSTNDWGLGPAAGSFCGMVRDLNGRAALRHLLRPLPAVTGLLGADVCDTPIDVEFYRARRNMMLKGPLGSQNLLSKMRLIEREQGVVEATLRDVSARR